jgi:Flp pilus assembly protein TadG
MSVTLRKAPGRRSGAIAHGQSVVEFALVVPFFLALVFGLLDFGRAVFDYNTIVNAARQGARYGITSPTDTSGIDAKVQSVAGPLGVPNGNITVQCFPANTSTFNTGTTCDSSFNSGAGPKAGDMIAVEVDYTYVPILGNYIKVPTITLKTTTRMVIT